jgi:hypothetical protein
MNAATTRRALPPPHVVVAAPGLAALSADVLARSRALARLAALATRHRDDDGLEHALVAAVGIATPAATLMARGAGLDAAAGGWLVADPVTLVAGIDDVLVAARVADFDATDATALAARLTAHFADDGIAFVAAHPARWYARLAAPARLTAPATDAAVGHSLRALRVAGDDARDFERRGNEIQMLLHAAPENAARESRGLAPGNGLWLWNAVAAAPRDAVRVVAIAAHDGDLARGMARVTGGVARDIDSPQASFAAALGAAHDGEATHVVVALPDAADSTLDTLDARWLAPAVDALRDGRARALTLAADGRGTHVFAAAPPRGWRRLAARWRSARFAIDG